MRIEAKQYFEDYLYLQQYMVAQTPSARQGRLQIKLARILFVFTLVSGFIFLITGWYQSTILLFIMATFFFSFPYLLRWLLKINIKRNYQVLLNGDENLVNIEFRIDEGRFSFTQGTTTFSSKTKDLKQYVETNEAIIIHIDGLSYCAIFKKNIEKWSAFVTDMKRYASLYKIPYTVNLSWNSNPFKEIKEK